MSLMGSSSLCQSASNPSLPSSIHSAQLLLHSHRKFMSKKRASSITSMASLCNSVSVTDEAAPPLQRRVLLIIGVSAIPFLQIAEVAAKEPAKEKVDIGIQDYRGSKLTESNISASGSRVMEMEIGLQIRREAELEFAPQCPREAEQDIEAQAPNLENPPEISSQQPKQSKQEAEQTSWGNSFISFQNGIGVVGSVVLGALFAASQRRKKALESTIDSMKVQMKEKEAVTTLLKENFGTRLFNVQEEHKRWLRKLKEEEASLSSQLDSAKDAVVALGRELQGEKRLVEEHNAQRDQLENYSILVREDKKILEASLNGKVDRIHVLEDKVSLLSLEMNEKEKNIQNLKSLLAERESECKNLSSTVEQAKTELGGAKFCIEHLKEGIFEARQEANLSSSIINDLHEKIKLLTEQKDDSNSRFNDLVKEYNDLISSSEISTSHDSEILSKKAEVLQQLNEKLELELSEATCKQTMISKLTDEMDNLNALLKKEKNDMYKLKNELQSTQELLANSKAEASDISNDLMEARTAYEEVLSKISKMHDEYDQKRKSVNINLEQVRSTSKILSDNLGSAKEDLMGTEEKLVSASNELKAVIEEQEILKKELVDTYNKLEAKANELKGERQIVSNLNKELEVLGKLIFNDSDARRTLEADLDEATRSLDNINKSVLLLSRELDNTNSRSASLEVEKEMLYNFVVEQKHVVKEMQENIDGAQYLITRLGSQRGNLEQRSKRLEEDLAAAKDEILRLREISSMTKANDVAAGTSLSVKRSAGRKKMRAKGSDVS